MRTEQLIKDSDKCTE